MKRLLIFLALCAVVSSTASSDLPSVQPQHENDVKLHSLLSIINAVRKLERRLDENQQQIGNNAEVENEKLRLEKNLEELRNVVNEHFINIEPHQQDEIVNVLRNIQLHFSSEPTRVTTEVSPRWFQNKEEAEAAVNGTNLLNPRVNKKRFKLKPRKLNQSEYKFNLNLDNKISSSEDSSSNSKSSRSSESESSESRSVKRKSKSKGSKKLHDFVSSSSSSDERDGRKKKQGSESKKKRPVGRPQYLPPNINSFWVDYWVPGPLPKPEPKKKAKSSNDKSSSSSSSESEYQN